MSVFTPHISTTGRLAGKVEQSPDGFYLRSVAEQAAWDHVPTLAGCLFCSESFSGTAFEAKAWNLAHREQAHPGLRSLPIAVRKKAAAQARSAQVWTR